MKGIRQRHTAIYSVPDHRLGDAVLPPSRFWRRGEGPSLRIPAILIALVEGTELTMLVRRLKRSRSALQDHKVRLGRLVREHLGEDILNQVQLEPAWTNTLDAIRERLACRTERRAA